MNRYLPTSARLLLLLFLFVLVRPEGVRALESRPVEFDQFFKSGDTVAFFGDSITHGGDYHALLQTFFSTRYPAMDLWTENVGQSGGTSWGAFADRMEGDLYGFEPDVVFVHFGMNDVGRDTFKGMKAAPSDPSRADRRGKYRKAMTGIVEALLARSLRVAIISPTLYDDGLNKWNSKNESPHLNAELGKFGEIGLELATAKSLPFIDVHTPLSRITEEKQATDDTFTFTADRVHPKKGGYPIMAWAILKDLGADPVVYDLHLSAAGSGSVAQAKQVEVTDLKKDGAALTWTSKEARLPFPVKEKGDDKAFALVPFQEDLNRMMLRIADLAPGKYALKIEGAEVGTYEASELAAGVNLSGNTAMPQYAEALKLRDGLIAEKLDLQSKLRDLNSYRLDLLSNAKTYPAILEIDWANPDAAAVIAIREQQVADKKAKGQNTSSYFGYITSQGRKLIGQLPGMKARLVAIRQELAALPAERTYSYRLESAQ